MPTPSDNLLDLLGDRRVEEYLLEVRGQRFILRFQPVVFFEHYDTDALYQLHGKRVFEVSFARLVTNAEGRLVARYDTTDGGSACYILGAVAHAILDWASEKRPDYLFWWTLDPKRQRLFNLILRYFDKKGSRWRRLMGDPFTGQRCHPETFWLSEVAGKVASRA